MQDVQPAELVDRRADRPLEALRLGYVGADCYRTVAGEMRGLLARGGVDLGDCDLGALAREQDGGGAADPGARAGDEGDLAVQTRHGVIPPLLV